MNEIRDKQYVALELTKLITKCDDDTTTITDKYKKILEELMEITDTIETTLSLKNEVDRLNKELEMVRRDTENNRHLLRIQEIIQNGKSDMEPYIYTAIWNECN